MCGQDKGLRSRKVKNSRHKIVSKPPLKIEPGLKLLAEPVIHRGKPKLLRAILR